MIKLISQKAAIAALVSILILIGYNLILGINSTLIFYSALLFLEGLFLNYICFRFKILGQKSSVPIVLFTICSVLIMPSLSVADIIYGAVWLGSAFLAFEARDNEIQNINYMILLGILLGAAQTINNISIVLTLPIFILFIQTGSRSTRGFILSLIYMAMVLFSYVGILYVMELEYKIPTLLPTLSVDHSVFDTILIKLFVPSIVIGLIIHLFSINNYAFRYPNKTKILNFTMLIQLIMSILLIFITAQLSLLIYAVMASTILLSYGFVYKQKNTFVNAVFVSILCIALCSLYLHRILIL
ncbi:hypothetical protein OAJ52_06750 [Bacteroidia bacterium]|nr:hypothetical protein [Bacteroidia bacterium]